MTLALGVASSTIKRLTRIMCRIDDEQLLRVPACGPLILVANHINFLEVPLLYVHLRPRPVTAFAKVETWNNPALGYFFTQAGAIPLHRGEADLVALRRGLRVLAEGGILAVAPEGTRSKHGRLQRGHPGAVLIALRSGAPVLPLAYWGGERLGNNLTHLRRTNFHILVGHPFHVDAGSDRLSHDERQVAVDEIMYQLAALLPPAYRGHYADLSAATCKYLRFAHPGDNNLLRAVEGEIPQIPQMDAE